MTIFNYYILAETNISDPAGIISMFPLASSARGRWLLCDGRVLDITYFPELFNVLKFEYTKVKKTGLFRSKMEYDINLIAQGKFKIPDFRSRAKKEFKLGEEPYV